LTSSLHHSVNNALEIILEIFEIENSLCNPARIDLLELDTNNGTNLLLLTQMQPLCQWFSTRGPQQT